MFRSALTRLNFTAVCCFLLLISSNLMAQNSSPLFDSPWRGFDTGTAGDGFAPASLAVGDIDADSDLDALVGNSMFGAVGISILKNRGDGSYELPVRCPLPTNETVGEVAINDFDKDGDLDALATVTGVNGEFSKIVVWRNNGNGTFSDRVEFASGQAPVGIAVADFTNDGFSDVMTANYRLLGNGNTVSLLRHNGQTGAAAGFLAPVEFTVGTGARRLAAADLNNDGKIDLAVGRSDTIGSEFGTLTILLNSGNGNFDAPVDYEAAPGSRRYSAAVALRDLDNDGDVDLMGGGLFPSGSVDNGAISIRRNNGSGIFGNSEIYKFDNFVDRPQKLTTADINRDGFADVLGASPTGRATDGFVVLLSNGTGGFQPAKRYEASQQTYDVAAADVDLDNDLDVLTVAKSSAAMTVYKNSGNAVFSGVPNYKIGDLTDGLDYGDIDRDGDLDIVASNDYVIPRNPGDIYVLKNNGDGTFAAALVYKSSRNMAGVKLRDLNGDGAVDILLASDPRITPYDFGVMLNLGNGTFAPLVITPVNACAAGSIDAFDLDNDGDLDVTMTEEGGCVGGVGNRVFVFRNNGAAQFTLATFMQSGGGPNGIGGADLNGDGRIDLLTGSTAIGVYLNNGNLSFQPETNSGSRPNYFTVKDFNRDGIQDVGMIMYTGNSFGTGQVGISLGLGNGSFALAQPQTGSSVLEELTISTDVDAADADLDGDLDLIVSNYASNDVSLFLNNGNGTLQPHVRFGVGYAPHFSVFADFTGDNLPDVASSVSLPPAGFTDEIRLLRALPPNSISGTVIYGITPANQQQKFVSGVLMSVAGASSMFATVDSLGRYQLRNLTQQGQYTVTPSKSSDINGITSFDATLVLRYVAANGQGANALLANQQTAADADNSGTVTAFDATQILRFVAANGQTAATGQIGTWKFSPVSRTYSGVSSALSNENYEAVLIGDVDGSWTP
ncbi:MAG: FG-GAP-like repeat-containing protein [Acidobacteriota bacterium]|nr:FG-GAP-like repeat-containing protein [Acidobacteriota bacterium]